MRRFPLHPLALLGVLLALPTARAFEFPAHSVSTSKQFIVFAEDLTLRSRVASFAEENKAELLSLLDTTDDWQTPVVVNFQKPDPSRPGRRPAQVTLYDTGTGMKLQIDVTLGANPDDIALQSRIVEALLLEMAYREQSPKQGEAYRHPPAWLVEGITERIRRKMLGGTPQVFEALLAANRLPPLATFLTSAPNGQASTWTQVFRAGSLALLDQLTDLPHGRKSLRRLIDGISRSNGDAVALLHESFETLGDSDEALEKWWALSVAKMAAANRYQGDDVAGTEARLAEILQFDLTNPKGEVETFALEDFAKFARRDAAKEPLARMSNSLIELSARGSALYRGIVSDYSEIVTRLARGKTRGLEKRLADLRTYRTAMLKRMDEIADYLNWMEGTQMQVRSAAFAGYFKAADEIDAWRDRRTDPVTAYVDLVEKALPSPDPRPAAVAGR